MTGTKIQKYQQRGVTSDYMPLKGAWGFQKGTTV